MLRERRRHANFKPNRKLDRKSSRGMIYENEELRIRTININAEVERGQSDIKKLRRENYQLRKEIWSLRDEYDRLDKLLRNKNCNGNMDGGAMDEDEEEDEDGDDDGKCDSCQSDEDSNSCDTCEDDQSDDNEDPKRMRDSPKKKVQLSCRPTRSHTNQGGNLGASASILKQTRTDKMQLHFDHLSVVSEECLTNSDDQTEKDKRSKKPEDDFIPESAVDLLTDFQSVMPPLSHFENLSYKDIGPNVDSQGEICYNSESTTSTGETVVPSKEWDFNTVSSESEYQLPPQSTSNKIGPDSSHSSSNSEPNNSDFANSDNQPAHFFSPIKSKQMHAEPSGIVAHNLDIVEQDRLGPDFHVSNVLAAASVVGAIKKQHPIVAKIEPIYAEVSKKTKCSSPSAFQTGGNLEDLLLDIEHLSNDIEQMQFENNRIYDEFGAQKYKDNQQQPYRSEMNLILSFDGSQPTFTEEKQNDEEIVHDTKYFEDNLETPPPKIPHAMDLLPNTLPYVKKNDIVDHSEAAGEHSKSGSGGDGIAEGGLKERNTNNMDTLQLPSVIVPSKDRLSPKPNVGPLATVRRHFFPRKSIVNKSSAIADNNSNNSAEDEQERQQDKCFVVDDESASQQDYQLAETINSTKDTKSKTSKTKDNVSDSSKRKGSRRVSIHFNGKGIGFTADKIPKVIEPSASENDEEVTSKSQEVYVPSLSARRQTLSRKMSQESLAHLLLPGSKSILCSSSPTPSRRLRSKSVSSRRHSSDGVVTSGVSHHHHHHGSSSGYNHHHPPSHHHQKDRDSYVETGTLISERCSNSLASSRESSTSLSQRSSSQQKSQRKMSISSHGQTNGKIPWCACWGNGCL